jgi:hypothetical protein
MATVYRSRATAAVSGSLSQPWMDWRAMGSPRLYPATSRVGGTQLLCRPEWVAAEPLALEQVALAWADAAPPGVDAGAAASAHLRPRSGRPAAGTGCR